MTSSRLPEKVLMQVNGRPLLSYMTERIKDSGRINQIIIATTKNPEDNLIADFAIKENIPLFRGSENNVLERFYFAAKEFRADHIMRLTADCPLIDPFLLDELVNFYFKESYDYVSNCNPPTLPDGLDAEIFSYDVLAKAYHC